MKRVLVACEFSQTVMREFYERGCDAFSCDLLDCRGPYPDRHIKGNCLDVLFDDWDLVIAHPPCTFLSRAGSWRCNGDLDRSIKMFQGAEFFKVFLSLDCRVCVENPIYDRRAGLPHHDLLVHPYDFGDPWTKATCLWLRRLPPFLPTDIVVPQYSFVQRYRDPLARSIFSPGIAKAMAEAWVDLL